MKLAGEVLNAIINTSHVVFVSSAICTLPVDKGNCNGVKTPRYAYIPKKGKCKKFKYTGCGGNENNFTTKKKCKKACKVSTPEG